MADPTLLITVYVFLIGLLLALGILLAFMPYLMRRQECFSVTVPAASANDPYLRKLKRRFATIMCALTAVLFIAVSIVFYIDASKQWDTLDYFLVAGDVILIVAYYALMLVFRKSVRAYKEQQGWRADAQRVSAIIGEEPPSKISFKWNLIYLLIMVITAIIGATVYPSIPNEIPMNINLDGAVTNWMQKSPAVVAFPVIVEGFLGACFAGSHGIILRSRKWSDPGAPATSALAYGLYARAWSVFSLVFGSLLSICIGALFLLSALRLVSLSVVCIVVFVVVISMMISAMALSVVYGQVGSRVFKRMQDSKTMPEDSDEHWKAGIIYFNPEDASVFLPERFGIGWTFNWARPASWVILIGFALVVVVFIVAVRAMV